MRISLTCVFFLPAMLLLAVVGAVEPAADGKNGEQHLVMLRNAAIEVGILPAAGGRAVVLRRPGGPNLLASDPTLWSPAAIPPPTALLQFSTVGGHMTWLAPQSEWWRQQQVTTEHYGMWPPDPWLIHGRFEVLHTDTEHLVVRGQPSPYSGVTLEKSYRLLTDGVEMTTRATNVRPTPVRWAIWSNLHPLASAVPYVPLQAGDRVTATHDGKDPATSGVLTYHVINGMLTVPRQQHLPTGVQTLESKFFLHTASPWLFAISSTWAVAVRGAGTTPAKAAPGESPLSLYLLRHRDRPESDLLELEHTGDYQPIAPNQSVSLTESWHVIDHDAGDDPLRQTAMAQQWLKSQK